MILKALLVLLLLVLSGVARPASWLATDSFPASLDFQLGGKHQFLFAGYYAALEKGFYRDVGLDVRIHERSEGKSPVEEVLAGRAQYAEGNSEVLLERLGGKPLVALAVILQHSPSVLLTRSDSLIRTPRDLVGKRVMLANGKLDSDFQAMFLREGVQPNRINGIPTSFDISDLLSGKVDAFSAYLSHEPFELDKASVDYFVINPAHYGIDYYSNILFTSERELSENPRRVEAFRSATLRGWRYALDNPDEIINLLIDKYHVAKSRNHLEFEARVLRSLILPELVEIGHMNTGRWQAMVDSFRQVGMVVPEASIGEGFIYDPASVQSRDRLWRIVKWFSLAIAVVFLVVLSMLVVQRRLRVEIRARREVEEQLRNTNVLLERVGRLAKVGGWELDLSNNQQTWTDEALRIRELPSGTVMSCEEAYAYYSPEDRAARLAEHEAAIQEGKPWEHESELSLPSGKTVWVHGVGEAVFREGKAVKLTGAIQDITERKRTENALLKRSRELEMHNRILRQINRGMPLDETLESMAWQIETLHPEMRCAVMLVDESDKFLRCGTAPSLPESFVDAINGLRIREGGAACGTAAHRCELVVVSDLEHHPYFDEFRAIVLMAGIRSCWSQPILDYGGSVLGTFAIYHRERVEPGIDETVLIETYAGLAGLVIERHRAEKRIRNLAFFDTLTQLPNRRMLDDRLNLAMALSKRTGRHGAVMFVDLDNFKPLNDAHGHAVGDLLLIEVARRLAGCVRETDTVARFGGDEFVVMLTELDTDPQESSALAKRVAEKIRATLAEPYVLSTRQSGDENLIRHRCTASIGIVLFVNHLISLEEVMRRADAAMYLAKDAGRNTVYFMQQSRDEQSAGNCG